MFSRAIPGPEFVSLSILLRNDISGGDAAPISCHLGGGGEPFLVSGPLSTVSKSSCEKALTELHLYINSVLKAGNATTKDMTTNGRFLLEDESLVFGKKKYTNATNNHFETQIFRPQKCHGMALQYHVVRDRRQISSFLVPLIVNASKASTGVTATIDTKEVTGVVFSVGMGGGPVAAFGVGTSALTYTLSHRMKKCLGILCSETTTTSINGNKKKTNITPPGAMDLTAAQSLLATLLLTDDEDRMANAMVDGEQRIDVSQEDQFTKRVLTIGSKKKKSGIGGDPLDPSSADQARVIVERMAVLSVCSSDSILRKYENRQAAKEAAMAGKSAKKKLRKLAKDADLDGFDFKGEKRSSSLTMLDISNHGSGSGPGSDDVSISNSSTFSSATLKGSRKDTATKSAMNRSRLLGPGLAPNRDGGRSRLNGFLNINNRDINRHKDPSPGRNRNMIGRRTKSMMESSESNANQPLTSSSFHDQKTDAFDGLDFASLQSRNRQEFDPFLDTTSDSSFGQGSASGGVKALVNVALNEDLTCYYKLSKLSSCSVEGVVQVQVRSNIEKQVPFNLFIKDPSNYIQNIQENKMFARGVTDKTKKSDHAFVVSVPKSEDYFPVMRYKCGEDLRPVPIRVQTRVRHEDSHWRVALQISSNPHNNDSLTDLTIIMGVPSDVDGESLKTFPPGGVWNASKRSVIWCVAELGGGEKFQLQARFEIPSNAPTEYAEEDKPKFPILVRCQCMYAQLSDIEINLASVPQAIAADVQMKLARRFRLSHRERP